MQDLFFVNVAHAGVDEFILKINEVVLNPLIRFMFVLALIIFFVGVVEFIANSTSDEGRKKGQRHMIWGLVGMTIMFSVWGILALVINTFGIQGIDPQQGTVELNDYNPNFPPN